MFILFHFLPVFQEDLGSHRLRPATGFITKSPRLYFSVILTSAGNNCKSKLKRVWNGWQFIPFFRQRLLHAFRKNSQQSRVVGLAGLYSPPKAHLRDLSLEPNDQYNSQNTGDDIRDCISDGDEPDCIPLSPRPFYPFGENVLRVS